MFPMTTSRRQKTLFSRVLSAVACTSCIILMGLLSEMNAYHGMKQVLVIITLVCNATAHVYVGDSKS